MPSERMPKFIKIFLICVLAVAGNIFFILVRDTPWLPLFVDTIFTVAVTFALGLFPGLAVAVLTWAVDGARWIYIHPFVIVSIVEVLLVHRLRPIDSGEQSRGPEKRMTYIVGIFVRLILIYAACVVAVSVSGGVIDFLYHTVLGMERTPYVALNALRMAFLREGIPTLAANILARLQINMADRFIVVFGGYLVSRGIAWVFGRSLARKSCV